MTNIQYRVLDRIYCAKTQATMNLVINMGDVELAYMKGRHEHYVRGRKEVAKALTDIENKPMSKLFKCKAQAYDYLDRRLERL